MTPYETFTGKKIDLIRDLRAEWGEPVVVKRPKGISLDLGVVGQWAVVTRRIMNGTGVLKVYLIQTKKFAYRLNFIRAKAPEWVLEALKDINPEASMGFKDESDTEQNRLYKMIDEIKNQDYLKYEDVKTNDSCDDEDIQVLEDKDKQTVVMQSIKSVEEAWDESYVKQEDVQLEIPVENPIMNVQPQPQPQGLYVTRSGRVSRPPSHLIETAYAIISETYKQNFYDEGDNSGNATVECTLVMKALLFQKAMEWKPEEAMKALREEVLKAVKIDVWEPVHPESLSDEEQTMIIPQMMNYLEKFRPDMSFDKHKVRVLTRGDKQIFAGESEGPVARVESLLMLLAIAAHQDLTIFKLDVGSRQTQVGETQ